MKQQLELTERNLAVVGEAYPLSPARALLSKVVSVLQIGLFVLPFLVGRVEQIRNHPYYQVFEQRKIMFLIGGYFLLNMLQNAVSSTGAFEVYLDNQLIFSKLASGRVPSVHELARYLN